MRNYGAIGFCTLCRSRHLCRWLLCLHHKRVLLHAHARATVLSAIPPCPKHRMAPSRQARHILFDVFLLFINRSWNGTPTCGFEMVEW